MQFNEINEELMISINSINNEKNITLIFLLHICTNSLRKNFLIYQLIFLLFGKNKNIKNRKRIILYIKY